MRQLNRGRGVRGVMAFAVCVRCARCAQGVQGVCKVCAVCAVRCSLLEEWIAIDKLKNQRMAPIHFFFWQVRGAAASTASFNGAFGMARMLAK